MSPAGGEARVDRAGKGKGLLIAAPMWIEALLVRSALRDAHVHRSGMGPRRSRVAADALLNAPGGRLLVLGFCGGLDQGSEPGEVVVADEVLHPPQSVAIGSPEGEQRVSCASSEELVEALGAGTLKVRRGRVASVSRLVLGEQRRKLHEFGAIAVDMESVWLAEGAGSRPFDVVRVVLDSPSHELLRPAAAPGAVRAARALRQVASLLGKWPRASLFSNRVAAGEANLRQGVSSG